MPGDSELETVDDLVQTLGRTTRVRSRSAAARHREAPTTCSRCRWQPRSASTPARSTYVSYDGGGPLTSALLGEKIAVGFSGLAEFVGQVESGELRVLAVSGEERYPDGPFAEVPTLTESGVDLVFLNWRGVLAPPEISAEAHRGARRLSAGDARQPGWKDTLKENGWTDDFKTGDEFATFLQEQDERVSGTLNELGLI